MPTRNPINLGESIRLKVILKDSFNRAVDPTTINLTISDPNAVDTIIDPLAIIKADVGFYYVDFISTVPGIYLETWTYNLLGKDYTVNHSFEVLDNNILSADRLPLEFNRLIEIEISPNIMSLDGEVIGDLEPHYFLTEMNPFYAPIEILRVECGSWLNDVPEETLALAIHWSSVKADELTCKKPVGERYYYARTRFVLFDAAISLFTMPVGSYGSNSKTHKTLGDLSVQNSDLDLDIKDLLKEYKEQRDEWLRILNAGGSITLGQSLDPTFAQRGSKRPDYLAVSRQWQDPWGEYFDQPTVNSKYKKPGEDKYKSGFTRWNQYYFTTTRVGNGGRR